MFVWSKNPDKFRIINNNSFKTMKKTFWIITSIIAIIFTCIAPWIFTFPAFCERLDFTSTGQIGDTIGGITSPIIGIVSIFLLIWTLKEQLEFNKKQAKDNALNQIHTLQSQIIQMDERFIFYFTEEHKRNTQLTGISSLNTLKTWNNNNVSINVLQAQSILGQLEIFISLCNCYKERLNETTYFNASPYNDFVSGYQQEINSFLADIVDGYVSIVDNPANSFYTEKTQDTEEDKSEIDNVRDCAKTLKSRFKK